MSLIFRIKGANFSGSGLPKLKRLIAGFPVESLEALYLFEDGTVGQPHSGTFVDSSGNGRHASLRTNWSAPTVRSYGVEGAAGGLSMELPITFGGAGSIVIAAKIPELDSSGGQLFPTLLGHLQDVPASPTTSPVNPNSGRAMINTQLQESNPSGHGNVAMYRYGGTPKVGDSPRRIVPNSAGTATEPFLFGLRWDTAAGTYTIKMSVGEYSGAEAVAHFDANSQIALGIMPWTGSANYVIAGAHMMLAAFYSDPDGSVLDAAMAAARARIEARGVVLV